MFTPKLIKFMMATIVKKPKMELTLRTPYQTLLSNFDGFHRVITKTPDGALIIQNRSPPALHILPPGAIRVRLTRDVAGVSGDFMHTGGWVIIHADNSCEINLMDIVDRKDVKPQLLDKYDGKDPDTIASKYASRVRKSTARYFAKKTGAM